MPQWNHCTGMNKYVGMKHCVWMDSQTNKQMDCLIQIWVLTVDFENCSIWPENSRLVNADGWAAQKNLLCEHDKPLQIAKFQYFKLVEDSSWFSIHWTASTVLEN